ncbi:uncharacterized protein LOC119991495 [Tripterygium wilfordii]|uniref:uncharacterized protein LOC119991495 n=1 Tax=Tripterygium wilfordii TaxID=458696 RepID=UPI0018F84259|nr:uncharacterized protein LOC119991495 [Tripterygium wilfordii]
MRIALSAKNKLGFIDDSIKTPPITDAKFPIWQRCTDMVLSWIWRSVKPTIASSILYCKTVFTAWKDLEDRFSQGNNLQIYQIRQEIVEHRQGQLSVSEYYTTLKDLWDELASYHEPIQCDCEGSKTLAERVEKERVMQFLMGLNDTYSTVRGSILMMNTLPDTRRTHGLILQHERQMDVANRRETLPNTHAMLASRTTAPKGSSNSGNFNSHKPLKCSYCDGDEHLADHCYYIHRFSVSQKWHGKNMTPRNKRPGAAAHHTEFIQATSSTTEATRPTTSIGPMFTTKEYNQLITKLRNGNGNGAPLANAIGIITPYCNMVKYDPHSQLYWIIDSWATDHISRLPPSHNIAATQHDFVGLPNGGKVKIKSIGSIKLSHEVPTHSGARYFLTFVDDSTRFTWVVERKHHHLINIAWALRFQANLPLQFWGESVQTACYLINHIPTPLPSHKSPYELLHGHMPNYSHLRVLGCLCYVTHLLPSSKFDARARLCIFLGYPIGQKGYRVYDLPTHKFFTSRDVYFHESTFPFHTTTPVDIPIVLPILPHDTSPLPSHGPIENDPSYHNEPAPFTLHVPPITPLLDTTNSTPPNPSPIISTIPLEQHATTNLPSSPRKSSRITRPLAHFKDYTAHHAALLGPIVVSSSTSSTRYPLHRYVSYAHLSPAHRAFVYHISQIVEPSTYE